MNFVPSSKFQVGKKASAIFAGAFFVICFVFDVRAIWYNEERGSKACLRFLGLPMSSHNGAFSEGLRQNAIRRIHVAGFKAIGARQDLEVRPLTLLAGANSSGKSSMMQAILLLKQTMEASYDPGSLLLNGANVKFTSVDQILHRGGTINEVSESSSSIGAVRSMRCPSWRWVRN